MIGPMQIGANLDEKVAALVATCFPDALVGLREPIRVSRDRDVALRIFVALAEVVGSWQGCDGYAHLCFGEDAGHAITKGCLVGGDLDEDPRPWSAHFHLGLIKEGLQVPPTWESGALFCARGETLEHAVALAVLKALSG